MTNFIDNAVIPFKIDSMEQLGEQDLNIYNISYKNSELKGVEFITYILNSSKLCNIKDYEDIPFDEKSKMMDILFNYSTDMVYIPDMFNSLMYCLFNIKGIEVKDYSDSFLAKEEIKQFIKENNEYMTKLIKFFDSLFVLMLTVSLIMSKDEDITDKKLMEYYKEVNVIEEKQVNSNVCSLLFESRFYEYYSKPIDESLVSFYKVEFTEKMFNHKTIMSVLLNNSNSIMNKMMIMLNNKDK